MDPFEKEYHLWMIAESVSHSVFYGVLNTVSDDIFSKENGCW